MVELSPGSRCNSCGQPVAYCTSVVNWVLKVSETHSMKLDEIVCHMCRDMLFVLAYPELEESFYRQRMISCDCWMTVRRH